MRAIGMLDAADDHIVTLTRHEYRTLCALREVTQKIYGAITQRPLGTSDERGCDEAWRSTFEVIASITAAMENASSQAEGYPALRLNVEHILTFAGMRVPGGE